MDEARENSRQTEQAAPTTPLSSQTTNPEEQDQAPLGWVAAVCQGFRTANRIGMASSNAVYQSYLASTAMPWTTLLTTAFCLAGTPLAFFWLLKILWSIAGCDISKLGAWFEATVAAFKSLWSPAQSQSPVPNATPTSVLPLSTGVTAVAALLSTEVASLAAASASIPGVASVVKSVFPGLGDDGLDGQEVVQKNWQIIASEVSTQSGAIIDRFHAALRHEDVILARVSRVAGTVADKGDGKTHGSNFLSIFRGSELKQRRESYQRMLDNLSMLNETGHQARDKFQAAFVAFKAEQLDKLNILVKLGHDNDPKGQDPTQAIGPGEYFRLLIEHMNKEMFVPKPGALWEPAPASSDPDQAAFVRGLHTAGGAGTMFDGAFLSAIDRLENLSKTTEMETTWLENNVKKWLERQSLPGSGCPTTMVELQAVAEEMVSLADKWRSKLQELYY